MLDSHQIDRTFMKWKKKTKQACFNNGQITRVTVQVDVIPIKFLSEKDIEHIIGMLQRNPPGIWCGYTSEQWLHSLKEELLFRQRRVDFFIEVIIQKFSNSELKSMFKKLEVGQ